MLYKSRSESNELLVLKFLNSRMDLSEKDKQHYFNIKKGYAGELVFDSIMKELKSECFILHDLLLKFNNTMLQIDSLIIFADTIHLFEVKNYEGDYYYEADRLYKKPKYEIINPLHQLGRTESLLRQLLSNLGFNIPIKASVIFVNPAFTLYQSPLDHPFIFPTQIHRHLKKLNSISSQLNEKHKMLADKLIALHFKESPFLLLPAYDYQVLQKGITCSECNSFSISVEGKKCICLQCSYKEEVASAVLRSVDELKLLFPNEKITTNLIYDWCKIVKCKKRIKRILEKNYRLVGVHRWSYFE